MDRQSVINEAREQFQIWVTRYQVVEHFPADSLKVQTEDHSKVWSVVWDDGGHIIAGFEPESDENKFPVVGYYVSNLPWDPKDSGALIGVSDSVLYPCESCGEEIDLNCERCFGEGELIEFWSQDNH